MTALLIESATKHYGALKAVHEVSLKVEPGERIALLGHNGAGKTTLIRMILGLTPLSSGLVQVLGAAPGSRQARASIGFLPENVAFHGSVSGREQLVHFARLKSVNPKAADDLLDRVGLSDAADRKIRTYSKGMRQRIGLAQALLGKPRLALLDEPTSGLDPILRYEFYDIVQELAQSGTAVLLSSHALTELETRTDRIAIMSKGRLVANDTLAALRERAHLPISVKVTTTGDDAGQIAASLGGTRVNGCSFLLSCRQDDKVEMIRKVTELGAAIKDIDINPASLEELYRYYGGTDQGGI